MEEINKYLALLEEDKRQILTELIKFMNENYKNYEESFDYKMPTYKDHLNKPAYVAFAARKNYFSVYTYNNELLTELKNKITSTNLGVGCARIKYKEVDMLKIIKDSLEKCL